MRIREVALALPVAALLAGSAAPAHANSPAFPHPGSGSVLATPYTTHSPSGSCIHAAILTLQDRRVFRDAAHVGQALEVITTHRHEMCVALVDYLKQAAA